MAVLSALPGVEVSIVVNNEELEEWDDPNTSSVDSASNSVTKIVQSHHGAEFSIKIKVDKPAAKLCKGRDKALSFVVSVDGRVIRRPFFRLKDAPETSVLTYARISETVTRSLIFQSVESTSPSAYLL